MKLAIFAGHVGKDPGAINPPDAAAGDRLYTVEAQVTAGVASKLSSMMKLLGMEHKIINGDWDARLSESADCDVGISIHADSEAKRKAHGYHVIYFRGSVEGAVLATALDKALSVSFDRARTPHGENLFILRKTAFPTALIELGFLSNVTDEALLINDEYQWGLAFQILTGFRAYHYNQVTTDIVKP
jgi:N-acetylmuramoyl-L-alanine amidase